MKCSQCKEAYQKAKKFKDAEESTIYYKVGKKISERLKESQQ